MIRFLIFLISFALALSFASKVFASDEGQYWNELKIKHTLSEKLDVHIKIEQRFVDDFNNLGLHNYAPGVVFKINQHFNFELNYKFEREKGVKGWSSEHRVEIIPVIKWEWREYQLNNRNRFEFRSFKEENKWRWREKLKIKKHMKIGAFEFTPFVSEEIFYDFKVNEFNQNRIATGISKEINKNLEINLYYLRKNNKRDDAWPGVNILGTEFGMKF